ncbi:hypothetical protein ACRAWG_29115 [Methylobacterium sp. P31]
MSDDDGFDRMVEAAIGAHQLLVSHGTPTMQFLSRLLLSEIGVEIAARRDADAAANDSPDLPEV